MANQAPLPDVAPADAAALAAMRAAGFVIRPVTRDSGLLDAGYFLPRPLTLEDMQALNRIGPNIHSLTLRDAGVSDDHIARLNSMPNLRSLRLDGNPIGDSGARGLLALTSLHTINLVGTQIGDDGLRVLSALPALQAVYVWRTRVTAEGAARARAAKPGLTVDLGLGPQDIRRDTTILLPR